MKVLGRGLGLCVGVVALAFAGQATAQENLDAGKTPAQLFASDCAICHKTPQGLAAKGGGVLGLESFLREHYTASRESASAIAGYLRSVGGAPAPTGRTAKRPPKGEDKSKPGEKTGEKKEDKPTEKKTGEVKPEPKSEPKTEEKADKPPGEQKPGEGKSGGGKAAAGGAPKPKSTSGKKPADGDKPN